MFTELNIRQILINNLIKIKKVKGILFGGLFASTLLLSTQSEAKIVAQLCHIYANGCIGTHTYHSSFFGLFTWETYEVVAC